MRAARTASRTAVHGIAAQHPPAEESAGGAQEEEDRNAVRRKKRGRTVVAGQQRRHPDIDGALGGHVEKRAERERQRIRVLHRGQRALEVDRLVASLSWSAGT